MATNKEEVTITKEEYDSLLKDRDMLACLDSCGVDNWDGYDFAIDEFRELHPELDE